MIVTCERCTTQFQLDDARIPPGGVRVRCSRCRHAFQIALPSPEPGPDLAEADLDETIPDIPPPLEPAGPEAATAEDPEGSAPVLPAADPTAFSDSSPLAADAEPEPEFATAGQLQIGTSEPESPGSIDLSSPGGLDGADPEEESDWQFNEDPPPGQDAAGDPPAAADVVDQFLGGTPETGSGDGDTGDGHAPSGLDLADDADDEGESLSLASDPRGEPPIAPATEAPSDPAPELASAPAVASAPSPESGPDELGELGDWDLFGEDEPGPAVGPAVHLPVVAPDEISPEDSPALKCWARWASRGGVAAGWVGVALLFAYGLAGAFSTDRSPTPPEIEGELEIVSADGVWIDNAVAGPIYVITGELRNGGAGPLGPPSLAVEVLDAEGVAVARMAPLEAPRARRELRERSPEYWPQGPPPGSGRRLASGTVVPFEAVVGPLPDRAHAYRVVPAPPPRRVAPKAPRPPVAPGTDPESPELVAEREAPASGASPVTPDAAIEPAAPPAAPVP